MAAKLQAPPIRKDGLQLDERRDFQRKFWTLERMAWLVFAVLVASALAGLCGGSGYFSRQSLAAGGALVDLPRISRWQGNEYIALQLPGGEGPHTIVLGGEFGEYFLIERTQPAPARSRATSSGLEMEFAGSGEGPSRVMIEVGPSRPGFASVVVAVAGHRAAAGVLVLP